MKTTLVVYCSVALIISACGGKREKEQSDLKHPHGDKYLSLNDVKRRLAKKDATNSNGMQVKAMGGPVASVPTFTHASTRNVVIALSPMKSLPTPGEKQKKGKGTGSPRTPEEMKVYRKKLVDLRTAPITGPAKVSVNKPTRPLTKIGEASKNHLAMKALGLLQGTTTTGLFDLKKVNRLIGALETIQSNYKGLMPLNSRTSMAVNSIIFTLTKKMVARLAKKGITTHGITVIKGATGIAALDALHKRFSAVEMQVMEEGIGSVTFKHALDTITVAKLYGKIPGIASSSPNSYVGGRSNNVMKIRRGNLLHLVFFWGWGDCPAGCIHHKIGWFTLDTKNQVVINENPRARKLKALGFPLWNVGSHFAAAPYKSYKVLRGTFRNKRWWMVENAVDTLGYLLSNPQYKRYEDTKNPVVFNAIMQKVKSERISCLNALVGALSHKEAGVVRIAHSWLKKLSKLNYGKDQKGIIKWRGWVTLQK